MNKKEMISNNLDIAEENNDKKEFLFYSAGTGRRILSFLADIFILFIISIFMYEIICFPIASAATNYETKINEVNELAHQRVDLFYDDDLLFYKEDKEKYIVEANIQYTGDIFLKFYTFKDGDNYTGLKEDPIFHYFDKIAKNKKTPQEINAFYLDQNNESPYFESYNPAESTYLVLKEEYVNLFKPYFDENDKVSDQTMLKIKDFKKSLFEVNYQQVIIDFSKTNETYKSLKEQINVYYEGFDLTYQITTIISFIIVFSGLFIICPLVDKKGRTLGKMVTKIERVDDKNFKYLSRKRRIAVIFLNLIEQLLIILFIPFISVGFTNIFKLSILLALTLVSAAYILVSLITCFANKFGKSLKEFLTGSIVVESSLMDTFYREVVYEETRD